MCNCIVVVPCYNEAARLKVDVFREFAARGHPQRFLFVDDGSTDDTRSVLETLRDGDPEHFEVHNLPRNMGKAEAVRQGILRALARQVELVGFWDADLATPLEAIPEFCDLLTRNPQLQMVIGARVKLLGRTIDRRVLRHYLGRVFATAASLVLRLPVYDTQCGAKLFRACPEVHALFRQPFRTNWIFDVELLARFIHGRKTGGMEPAERSIYELPLTEWRDVTGSKVRVRDFFKSFFELARICWVYLRPGAAGTRRVWPRAGDNAAAGQPADSPRGRRAA